MRAVRQDSFGVAAIGMRTRKQGFGAGYDATGGGGAVAPPCRHDPSSARRGESLNRRFLAGVAAVAAVLLVVGLLGVDRALAEWVHSSGHANIGLLRDALAVLDAAIGMHVWYWMTATVLGVLGLAGTLAGPRLPLPRRLAPALLAAGLVQAGTIAIMILGKSTMGRLRPYQVFETGDWTNLWFAGGVSFPSGHASYYFGVFLPLAATAPRAWQRAVLLAVPVLVAITRIDMSMHFLSDVATPALVAAGLAFAVGTALRRWLPAPV